LSVSEAEKGDDDACGDDDKHEVDEAILLW
jgi:hypothetical protein